MNFDQPEWQIISLEKKHKKNEFNCGNENLNNYLKKYARQNHEKGIAKTFVAISNSKNDLKVKGYYTLSASIIEFESLPKTYQKKLPAYPIPTLLIGKLAVDKTCQGLGLGTELLINALHRAVKTSLEIGIFAVRVDAIDLQTQKFYLKYEFIPFEDQELSLFLPISTIQKQFILS